jgi:hypothetical protein
MAKIDSKLVRLSITRKFEELPLLIKYVDGERMKALRLDGEFEVAVDVATRDWHICDISILVDNGRHGAAARADLVPLDADEALHLLILDALVDRHGDWIEEQVAIEIGERAIRAPNCVELFA